MHRLSHAGKGSTPSMLSKPTFEELALGYVGGVAVATLIHMIGGFALPTMLAGSNPFRPDRLFVLIFLGLAFGVVTAFTAWLPCVAAEGLAVLLCRRPAWYFTLWGAAAGLTLGPCVAALNRGFATDGGLPLPELWADRYTLVLANTGPLFAFSGLVGGLTYWWISVRRAGARTSHGPS